MTPSVRAKKNKRALRELAETQLGQAHPDKLVSPVTDTDKLLHELQVHQFELEMQNQELRQNREQLEEALARYTALYDFAPAGYMTLDAHGTIRELNLAAANLLGKPRAVLRGHLLGPFLSGVSRRRLQQCLRSVNPDDTTESMCEVDLVIASRPPQFAQIRVIAGGSHLYRVTLLDITQQHEADQRAQRLLQENRALTRLMFEIQEQERRELALELHDDLGQWLTAIQAEAEAIRAAAPARNGKSIRVGAEAISQSAAQVHRVVGRMLNRLRPGPLTVRGLGDSLRELLGQWRAHHPAVRCSLRMQGRYDDIGESLAIVIYRVVQEALTNIARHSHAKSVKISLQRAHVDDTGEQLQLSVQDDGIGIKAEQPLQDANPGSGLGLMGMRERVIAMGGTFALDAAKPRGVRIHVFLPVGGPHAIAVQDDADADNQLIP